MTGHGGVALVLGSTAALARQAGQPPHDGLPHTAAREYLAGLLEYLESFYERTQPLSSLGKARTATSR